MLYKIANHIQGGSLSKRFRTALSYSYPLRSRCTYSYSYHLRTLFVLVFVYPLRSWYTYSYSMFTTDGSRAGDSTTGGNPVFLQEPAPEYYIIRGNPVRVTCQAAPAVQISFKCAEQWIRPKYQTSQELVHPETGVTYLESSIEVEKEEVEALEAGQRYWCECHAWNNMPHSGAPQSALSRRGVIRIASKSP